MIQQSGDIHHSRESGQGLSVYVRRAHPRHSNLNAHSRRPLRPIPSSHLPPPDVICSLCLSTWFRAIRRCIGCKLKRAPKPWEEEAVVPRLARCESARRTARAHTHGLAVVPATLPMPLWGAAQALAFGIRLSWPLLFLLFLLRAAAGSRAGQVEKVWVVHEQHRFCFHFVSHQLLI